MLYTVWYSQVWSRLLNRQWKYIFLHQERTYNQILQKVLQKQMFLWIICLLSWTWWKVLQAINILWPVKISIKVKHIWIYLREWCCGNYLELSFVLVVYYIDLECYRPHWDSGRCSVSAALSSLQKCRVETPVAFQKLTLPSKGHELFFFFKVQAIQGKISKQVETLILNLKICLINKNVSKQFLYFKQALLKLVSYHLFSNSFWYGLSALFFNREKWHMLNTPKFVVFLFNFWSKHCHRSDSNFLFCSQCFTKS